MTIHSLYIYDRYGLPLNAIVLTTNRPDIARVSIITIGTVLSVLNLHWKAGSLWPFPKLFPQLPQLLGTAIHLHPPLAIPLIPSPLLLG